jgi:hypothetical protein
VLGWWNGKREVLIERADGSRVVRHGAMTNPAGPPQRSHSKGRRCGRGAFLLGCLMARRPRHTDDVSLQVEPGPLLGNPGALSRTSEWRVQMNTLREIIVVLRDEVVKLSERVTTLERRLDAETNQPEK